MLTNFIALGAGIAIFAALILSLLVHADRQRRRHRARLHRVRLDNAIAKPSKSGGKKTRKADKNGLFARIETHLAQTSLRVSPTELLVQMALGLNPLLALPLAIAAPLFIAAMVVRIAKDRYRLAFTSNLPEALDVFARELRAGRPVSDSLAIVVDTSNGPIQHEFTRCHDEICMGKTLADSLARLQIRIATPEVSFFSGATSLQTETGGNLIETMENLATQLRERRKLRKKARALSSVARASAIILASLPFAVALAIAFMNGAYLEPLYGDPRGRVMTVAALASIGLGALLMKQMGKLDV